MASWRGRDRDDACDMTDVAIVTRPVDRRNELVVRVLDVLIVLTVLITVVLLTVEEGDDKRIFEPDFERVRAFIHPAGAGHQVISE
jgi:hypothetical protein